MKITKYFINAENANCAGKIVADLSTWQKFLNSKVNKTDILNLSDEKCTIIFEQIEDYIFDNNPISNSVDIDDLADGHCNPCLLDDQEVIKINKLPVSEKQNVLARMDKQSN